MPDTKKNNPSQNSTPAQTALPSAYTPYAPQLGASLGMGLDTPGGENAKEQVSNSALWDFIDEVYTAARNEREKSGDTALSDFWGNDAQDFQQSVSGDVSRLDAFLDSILEWWDELRQKPRRFWSGVFIRAGFYLSIFLAAVCVVVLGLDYYRSYRDNKLYEGLVRQHNEASPMQGEQAVGESDSQTPRMLPHLVPAYEQNNQLVGWITVDGTTIDFPVMQCGDNDYYLTANFNNQQSKHGTPFVDYRIDLSGQPVSQPDNLIVYGHNMNDGKMFGDFVRYSSPDFYTAHPAIRISSLYDERVYVIFAAFITNGETQNGYVFPYHMYLNFYSEDEFYNFISELKDRSIIEVDLDVRYGDKLLCASTCTYEFDGARFVVFARELRQGEEPVASPVKRSLNPAYPAAFTRLYGGRTESS